MKSTWINLSLVAEICSPAAVLRLVTPGGMFLPCHQNGENYDYDYADFFLTILTMKMILNVPASWCPAPRA